ncbi:MAG: 30S ribosomal protein S9 [Odoribacteraceae bacterium]|jgi:small subunit ribosomal protein S9|nr:30S ribosomal protein S9 [Odoribacteraceae bacterium]
METINATGRRKTAVARVYLSEGKGNIVVNKKAMEEYFSLATLQYKVKQPLELLGVAGQYDVKAILDGGGFNGQAEALRLGISRALVKINAEDKPALRAAGFITRDPREVERKKPGQPGARKRFQFSKR